MANFNSSMHLLLKKVTWTRIKNLTRCRDSRSAKSRENKVVQYTTVQYTKPTLHILNSGKICKGWSCILKPIIPTLIPSCFLLICYPYILLHFLVLLNTWGTLARCFWTKYHRHTIYLQVWYVQVFSFIIWLTKPWMDNPRMPRSDWIHFVFLNWVLVQLLP